MPGTRYTDEDKRRAVEVYEEHGATEAAKEVGCDRRSVLRWAKAAGVSRDDSKTRAATEALAVQNAERREGVKAQLLDRVIDLIERMDQPHERFMGGGGETEPHRVVYDRATSGDVKAYSISVGVLIDKLRLEEGQATERTETMTEEEARRRLAEQMGVDPERVTDELADLRKRRRKGA